ncbi:hypothetical protein HHK36_026291 [Tetracentron sinense]|uniref:Uncharacterized protein n=1 Tax=Tetracentron sinense TaxID=13715 RepID=A0A834YJ64_TETSI|nr:hypothetical protein HHK36_026291 [Tetracentron sinense]
MCRMVQIATIAIEGPTTTMPDTRLIHRFGIATEECRCCSIRSGVRSKLKKSLFMCEQTGAEFKERDRFHSISDGHADDSLNQRSVISTYQSLSLITTWKLTSSQQNGGGDYTSIEMGILKKQVVDSIKGKLDRVPTSAFRKTCCIYRVQEKFRKINKNAYMPDTVAIGPFHRGEERLKLMEEHKLRYLHTLLDRTPERKLEEYVEAMSKLEERARKYYSEPINLAKDEFLEMMLVDGLFVIELFRKSSGEVRTGRNDPIFNTVWGMASIVRDLILIENQLPIIVLECLFDLTRVPGQGGRSLTQLALLFFNSLMPRDEKVLEKYSKCEGKHLLDLFGNTFHALPPGIDEPNSNQTWKFMPCVTELRQAGVKFKKGNMTCSFLDIKFKDGVLEIPPLLIQDQTETLLRNLIASEQCCNGRATYITSYAFLMDSLINSADDVKFLRRHEIITNYLGDDEGVSTLFNNLCNEVTLVNFKHARVCDLVNAHYKARRHVWRAMLMRNYFHSPWAILSFIAAILLLIFTFTGTLFSILSYTIQKP